MKQKHSAKGVRRFMRVMQQRFKPRGILTETLLQDKRFFKEIFLKVLMVKAQHAFVTAIDTLANLKGMSRAELLRAIGRSPGMAGHWANATRPKITDCIDLATIEIELKKVDIADDAALEIARRWLQLGNQKLDNQTIIQLLSKEGRKLTPRRQSKISNVIHRLKLHGEDWENWASACVEAQQAARARLDRWLKKPPLPRQVWHFHTVLPHSASFFASEAVQQVYDQILGTRNTELNLMLLQNAATPAESRLNPESTQPPDFLQKIIAAHPSKKVNSEGLSVYLSNRLDSVPLYADQCIFAQYDDSFGLVIGRPEGLHLHLEAVDADQNLIVELGLMPITVGSSDCLSIAQTMGLEPETQVYSGSHIKSLRIRPEHLSNDQTGNLGPSTNPILWKRIYSSAQLTK